MELRPAAHQIDEHGLATLAEVLGHSIEQLRVTDLVLDLGGEGHLPLEARREGEAFALGKGSHDLGVRVHLDELQDTAPVVVGHPVLGLDLAALLDVLVE